MTKKKLHSLYVIGFLMIMYDLTGCFYDHEKHRNATNTNTHVDISAPSAPLGLPSRYDADHENAETVKNTIPMDL